MSETALVEARQLQPGDRLVFGNGHVAVVADVMVTEFATAVDVGEQIPITVGSHFEFRVVVA